MPHDRFDWERALRGAELPGTDLLVLLMTATYWDRRTGRSRVTVAELARALPFSDSTIRRALKRAQKDGWLIRTARGHRLGDGSTTASEYALSQPVTRRTVEGASQPVTKDDQLTRDLNRSLDAPQPVTGDTSTGHPGDRPSDLSETSSSSELERLLNNKAPGIDLLDFQAGCRVRGIRSPGGFLRSPPATLIELRRIARAGYIERSPLDPALIHETPYDSEDVPDVIDVAYNGWDA